MHLYEQETKIVKHLQQAQVRAVAFPGLLNTSEDTSSK